MTRIPGFFTGSTLNAISKRKITGCGALSVFRCFMASGGYSSPHAIKRPWEFSGNFTQKTITAFSIMNTETLRGVTCQPVSVQVMQVL